MKKIALFVTIFFFLLSNSLLSQSAEEAYSAYINQVKTGTSQAQPYSLLRSTNNTAVLKRLIAESLNDTTVSVRKACYQSLDVMQKSAIAPVAKQQILALQLRGMEVESSDIVGLSIQNLSSVPPSLFNASQKTLFIQTLDRQVAKKEVLIKMVGTLKDESAAPALRQLSQPGNSAKVRWAAYLALARLGDQTAINLVNNKVRGIEVNDDMVYDMAPSIIYTQQKQLYD